MAKPKFAALALPLAVLACAPVATGTGYVENAPEARAIGPAKRCLNASTITRSVVQDDRTIDFKVGSNTWRNTLPSACGQLGFERAISYDLHSSSLCAGETVYVLDTSGGTPRRTTPCALGEFVPVEYVRR